MTARVTLPAVALAFALASCAGVSDAVLGPGPEPSPQGAGYLQGGPQTKVDLGDGGEQLLTRFQKLLEENRGLEERNRALANEVEGLRGEVDRETAAAKSERQQRAGVEAENDRLRKQENDRQLEILHLQLQAAELERKRLQLEIADTQRQIHAVEQSSAESPSAEPAR